MHFLNYLIRNKHLFNQISYHCKLDLHIFPCSYTPASRKLPNDEQNSEHSVSSKLVSDISTHESCDVTAPQLQTPCSEQNVVVKSMTETGTVIKVSTAVSKFLETPTHPSKYPTKNPKSCERVLTSLENMQKMEEKELEKCNKRQPFCTPVSNNTPI